MSLGIDPTIGDGPNYDEIADCINVLADFIYDNAYKKGFWDDDPGELFTVPRKIGLIHTEISEALDEHHNGLPGWQDRFAVELADAIIRIIDLAAGYDHKIGTILIKKHRKNLNRPRKHGKRY